MVIIVIANTEWKAKIWQKNSSLIVKIFWTLGDKNELSCALNQAQDVSHQMVRFWTLFKWYVLLAAKSMRGEFRKTLFCINWKSSLLLLIQKGTKKICRNQKYVVGAGTVICFFLRAKIENFLVNCWSSSNVFTLTKNKTIFLYT